MYKHILVALDGRPESEQALKQAVGIAKFFHADLTSLSIIEHLPSYAASVGEVDEVIQESDRFFQKLQEHAVKVAQLSGITLNAITRKGNAAQTIIRFAIENSVDLIVVGAESHRKCPLFSSGGADRFTFNPDKECDDPGGFLNLAIHPFIASG
jgi:nucleotide-binding universal stress UspA family protein